MIKKAPAPLAIPGSPSPASSGKDLLTVMIFKENRTPRTFKIRLRSLSHFGLLLGAILMTSFVSVGLALRLASMPHDSALERRIDELQAALTAAQNKQGANSGSNETLPAPDVVPVEPEPAFGVAGVVLKTSPGLFQGLALSLQDGSASPSQGANDALDIQIGSTRAAWSGNQVQVSFNIQYIGQPGGRREGRILLLARGPSALLIYPEHAFHGAGHETLIDANHGEHFSVGRFRQVRTTFGPVPSRDWLDEIEVLIISDSGHILVHHKMDIEGRGKS